MGLIYMRISPNGGKYIGLTKFSEEKRWAQHTQEAYDISNDSYETLLNKAIRKYGEENFSVVILENNIPNEELGEREKYWIKYYKSYYKDNPLNYNMTRGGYGIKKHIIPVDELLALWEEPIPTREIANLFHCSRNTIKDIFHKNGYKKEDIILRGKKLAELNRKRKYENFEQQILQLWEEGYTITKIAEYFNTTNRRSISRILYKNNITSQEIKNRRIEILHSSTRKTILQYDLNNNFIKEWKSCYEVQNFLNIYGLYRKIKNPEFILGGFLWKIK